MRDIAERAAMDQRRIAFERLDEIRINGFLEQDRHRAVGLQLARRHRPPVAHVADDDAAEALLEVFKPACEAKDRHHLGGDGDVETRFPREAVGGAADRLDDVA